MKTYSLALLVLPVLFSCASSKISEKVVRLDPSTKETVVHLTVGQTVKIEAEKNPSTGYNWHLEVPAACSATFIQEDVRNIYNDGRIGAPVVGVYEFKATSSGECKVEFDYSRSWEGKSNQPHQVKFIVK